MQTGNFHAQGIACWLSTYLDKSLMSAVQRKDGLIMNEMKIENVS